MSYVSGWILSVVAVAALRGRQPPPWLFDQRHAAAWQSALGALRYGVDGFGLLREPSGDPS